MLHDKLLKYLHLWLSFTVSVSYNMFFFFNHIVQNSKENCYFLVTKLEVRDPAVHWSIF